jgi:hypothetical protein
MAKTKNTVLGPLVIVKDEKGADHYFYQGAVLPEYVKGDALKALVDSGLVGSEEDLVEAQAADNANPAVTPAKAPAKS